MFRVVGSLVFRSAVFPVIPVRRSLYGVKHNSNRGIFYIRLEDDDTAVLSYVADGKILDIKWINVPSQHQGRGLARLLAEAAFTYAIVNNRYMLLSCEYTQKLYRATKSPELEELVLGPKQILKGPESTPLDTQTVYDLPDPEDFTRGS